MANFSLTNKTRGKVPRIPFAQIKDTVLGADYELSLALVTPAQARAVTRKTKGTNEASNVLSFNLSKKSGEIILCPATARKQAPAYGLTYPAFMAKLFIHGCCHLVGYTHSVTMERKENQLLKKFDIL